jgi:vacuolar protein sorting-associated protein 26
MTQFLQSLKGLISPATINIAFEGEVSKKKIPRPDGDKRGEPLVMFASKDPVKGTITLTPLPGKKVDYTSITCQFVGLIELFGEKTIKNQFITVEKELDSAGTLLDPKTFPFDFSLVRKEFETYYGINVTLRFARHSSSTASHCILSFLSPLSRY